MNLEESIWRIGLENAIEHSGKTTLNVIMKRILNEFPEYKQDKGKISEVKAIIDGVIAQINNLSIDQQKKKLEILSPIERKKVPPSKEMKELPDLPNIEKYEQLVFRMAPYPSGPLHIGNARMVILNDMYKRKYDAKLYLIYDDTIGSEEKIIIPEAYDLIKDNLDWLGVKVDKIFYKSDRIPVFYDYCKRVLEKNAGYICTCDADVWRNEYKKTGQICPHRDQSIEKNLEHWEKMLDGTYQEREAVVRLKTGMDHPNPSIRDHVIMRISEREHPRVGTKYRVWPLLEFSWGIDDHLLGITHILRGKDLIKEDIIETFIWEIFNWPVIEFQHYGMISFEKLKLSKTQSRKRIKDGSYSGWEDPRTWSLNSLAKRGILPESLRDAILDLGLSNADIHYNPEILYGFNRKRIDKTSNRYFFVADPIELTVYDVPEPTLIAKPPLHPDYPERGYREIYVSKRNDVVKIFISGNDLPNINKGMVIRLKDLFNIEILDVKPPLKSKYHSKEVEIARDKKAKIFHWVPTTNNVPISLILDDGQKVEGFGEKNCENIQVGEIVQFERFGFVKINEISPQIRGFFTHR